MVGRCKGWGSSECCRLYSRLVVSEDVENIVSVGNLARSMEGGTWLTRLRVICSPSSSVS